jgi:hypothetical protein
MNPGQKGITIVVFAITVASIWFAVRKISERDLAAKEKGIKAESAQRELRTSVENMAAKYNATTNWVNLFDKEHSGRVFTIDVEEALRPTTVQPVLLVGRIEDLIRRNGKYYVSVNSYSHKAPQIYYILECDGDQANTITKHGRGYGEVAVIASIDSVKKPDLEVNGISGTDGEIEINPTDSPFVANGRCLDLLFIAAGHWE